MIKSIETEYRGTIYRSKLEARWCVFFDTLGVKYEYEPQHYDLGFENPDWNWLDEESLREELSCNWEYDEDDIRREVWKEKNKKIFYLPDFWLPEFQHWIEIKGKYPTVEEQRKARYLAYHTGFPATVLYGNIPDPKEEDWAKNTEVYQSDMNIIALLVIKYGVKAMQSALTAARQARFAEAVHHG